MTLVELIYVHMRTTVHISDTYCISKDNGDGPETESVTVKQGDETHGATHGYSI